MNRVLLTFVLLLPVTAFAVWSAFAHVTPDTREEYDMPVCVASMPNAPDLVRIRFPLADDRHKNAWLIITKTYLPAEQQEFRRYLWADSHIPELELVSEVSNLRSTIGRDAGIDEPELAEIQIARELMSRAYVYIDFPHATFDGGYYYSIDLSTFVDAEDDC